MAITISGEKMNKMVAELRVWAADYRLKLYEAMTQDTPYRAVKLTSTEQFQQFISMQPEDLEMQIMKLNDKYLGQPDAFNRVNEDLANYVASMIGLLHERGGV